MNCMFSPKQFYLTHVPPIPLSLWKLCFVCRCNELCLLPSWRVTSSVPFTCIHWRLHCKALWPPPPGLQTAHTFVTNLLAFSLDPCSCNTLLCSGHIYSLFPIARFITHAFPYLCFLLLFNIIRTLKSKELTAWYVARNGARRGAYTFYVGKPVGKRLFGRSKRRWEDNIKINLQEKEW
jgi:hypothetical protein